MKKRVLVGGFHHESDTFNPIITNKDDIVVNRGESLLNNKNKNSITGIISKLKGNNFEVIPSLHARAVPNGIWDKDYYSQLKEEFLTIVKESLPLDGVCLALHGSMIVEKIGHAEQDILLSLREIVGQELPIIASLDMHATFTKEMFLAANGFVGYKEAPHTDTFETGEKAASILADVLENKTKIYSSFVKIPIIIAGEQSETSTYPMKDLISNLRKLEEDDENIISTSYLLGFPWADTAEMGVTALVLSKNSTEHAEKIAKRLAKDFWDKRKEFSFQENTFEMKEAIEKAKLSIRENVYPVVLSDSGDNPTAGSSGDVTTFLSLLLKDEEITNLKPPLLYQSFYDPLLTKKAIEAGVENRVVGELGASFDKEKSQPIKVNAIVKAIVKDFERANNSDLVLLEIDGINVVVTEKHVGSYDVEMMKALGVIPEERKIIVVKLGYLEPEIKAVAKHSILVLTNGSTNEVFSKLDYKNILRPIYPIDEGAEYENICLFSK